MNKNTLILITLAAFTSSFISACDYDDGYESAWGGDASSGHFYSEDFQRGYEDGWDDAALYDDGFDDGRTKAKAKFPKDEFYMEGYLEGRRR